jgi:hypothetical protein
VVLRYEHMLRVLPILLSSVLVLSSAASTAAEGYDPNEFLNLDLSKAVLSPKPLGPANTFGTVTAKVRADSDVVGPHTHARSAPSHVRTEHVRTAHATAEKPRGTARTRLAHRHRNPLDAQAMDTRIQVWPCKSGGICKWKQ